MKRAQILFEPRQYEALKKRSASSGQSIGALVREAVDQTWPAEDPEERRQALAELLAMDPCPVPEDPRALKQELLRAHEPSLGGP